VADSDETLQILLIGGLGYLAYRMFFSDSARVAPGSKGFIPAGANQSGLQRDLQEVAGWAKNPMSIVDKVIGSIARAGTTIDTNTGEEITVSRKRQICNEVVAKKRSGNDEMGMQWRGLKCKDFFGDRSIGEVAEDKTISFFGNYKGKIVDYRKSAIAGPEIIPRQRVTRTPSTR